MSPPLLLLVRHGQTRWNAERRVLGRTDLPLDELGLTQAELVAPALGHIDAIWSSPLLRARQTAAAILASRPHLTLQIEPDLTEMDQGELDGLDEAGLRERFGTLLVDWARDPAGARPVHGWGS